MNMLMIFQVLLGLESFKTLLTLKRSFIDVAMNSLMDVESLFSEKRSSTNRTIVTIHPEISITVIT